MACRAGAGNERTNRTLPPGGATGVGRAGGFAGLGVGNTCVPDRFRFVAFITAVAIKLTTPTTISSSHMRFNSPASLTSPEVPQI